MSILRFFDIYRARKRLKEALVVHPTTDTRNTGTTSACTVCRSPRRQELDQALLAGTPASHIARELGVNRSSVTRHFRQHVQPGQLASPVPQQLPVVDQVLVDVQPEQPEPAELDAPELKQIEVKPELSEAVKEPQPEPEDGGPALRRLDNGSFVAMRDIHRALPDGRLIQMAVRGAVFTRFEALRYGLINLEPGEILPDPMPRATYAGDMHEYVRQLRLQSRSRP